MSDTTKHIEGVKASGVHIARGSPIVRGPSSSQTLPEQPAEQTPSGSETSTAPAAISYRAGNGQWRLMIPSARLLRLIEEESELEPAKFPSLMGENLELLLACFRELLLDGTRAEVSSSFKAGGHTMATLKLEKHRKAERDKAAMAASVHAMGEHEPGREPSVPAGTTAQIQQIQVPDDHFAGLTMEPLSLDEAQEEDVFQQAFQVNYSELVDKPLDRIDEGLTKLDQSLNRMEKKLEAI